MKREINCPGCQKRWAEIPDYPGEKRRAVELRLTRSCLCDGCAMGIIEGEAAWAFTLWVEHPRGLEPGPWEDEYGKRVDG